MPAETLGDVAAAVYADPAPLVFVDTCALLDVVRAPLRGTGVAAARGAQALRARAAAPRTAWIIAADVVIDEWQRHVDATVGEVARAIQDAERVTASLVAAAAVLAVGAGLAPFRIKSLALEQQLAAPAMSLVQEVRVFAADDAECATRAYLRTALQRAPSDHGKPERADCLIIEHYLEIARQLRGGGFAYPICFVSSNTADYGTPRGMREPLPSEFAALNITYVTDLAWAEQIAAPTV